VHVTERSGFARGFDRWETLTEKADRPGADVLLRVAGSGEQTVELRSPDAAEVNAAVARLLPEPGAGPLFLYVHYMEPHPGYAPPEPFRTAFASDPRAHERGAPATATHVAELAARGGPLDAAEHQRLLDLYDAEIAAVDAALGELLDELRRRGFADDAVTVLASDHGEEFGEHDGWFHGLTLHRESLSVPLLIHDSRRVMGTARRSPGAARRDEPVDLLDVPTTLLALAGVDPAPGMRGRDLLAGQLGGRDLVAELHPDPLFAERVRPREQRLSLLRWPWKALIRRDGGVSLYRLDRDPGEVDSLAAEADEVGADLGERAARLARALDQTAAAPPGQPPDPQTLEALRALGYAK
jgi:arylsulfatase A-like enzyme